MKKILVTIDFTDSTPKGCWWDSQVKNKVILYDPEKQTIHECIKDLCEDVGMELTYKGKPRGNVFRDQKDGSTKRVGYMYRGKGEIYDRSMPKPLMTYWDIWVTIQSVEEFEIVDVEC